jgi:hypothetical protein
MRRLSSFRFLSYVVLAVLVTLGGVRLVLSSGFAANRVADRLSELLGVPVRVGSADIGLRTDSSLRKLEIYESGDNAPDVPWAVADDVRADFSAVDMFGDDLPKEVVFEGAAVELRFDESGRLLTHLPKPGGKTEKLPLLRVEGATLTLRQDGRDQPLVITGVSAKFTYADRVFDFTGTFTEERWGTWEVNGSYDAKTGIFKLDLKTDRVDVDEEKLALVPFVPLSVWKQVRISAGTTSVQLSLTVDPAAPAARYRVELHPTNTKVLVTSIDLEADGASGTVLVQDRVVELRNVKGRTANGGIETEADLDFRDAESRLAFTKIKVSDVELQYLPESWFPDSWKPRKQRLNGRLSGDAKLDVIVKADAVVTNGTGKGDLSKLTIQDRPAPPLKLNLKATDGRFHIMPMVKLLPF